MIWKILCTNSLYSRLMSKINDGWNCGSHSFNTFGNNYICNIWNSFFVGTQKENQFCGLFLFFRSIERSTYCVYHTQTFWCVSLSSNGFYNKWTERGASCTVQISMFISVTYVRGCIDKVKYLTDKWLWKHTHTHWKSKKIFAKNQLIKCN